VSTPTPGFGRQQYVPLILVKRGERKAVIELPPFVKGAMTPIFVVPPIDWNYDSDSPLKTAEDHLAKLPGDMQKAWGSATALVDMLFIDDQQLPSSGVHPLVWFTDAANALGLPLIPTTGLDRTPAYTQATADVHARDHRGVCLRLTPAEWPIGTSRTSDLRTVLRQLGVTPSETDLVLDVAEDVVSAPALTLAALAAELASLPNLNDWRSLTVLSAGFPKGAGQFAKGMNYIDRLDWLLYQQLIQTIGRGPRHPSFGDYVVAHPDPIADVDPRFMQSSGTLRYTAEREWLYPKGELFRGRGTSGYGAASIPPLASMIANDPRFLGATHCSTEQWIIDVANGIASGSNPEMWRRRGTHHHLRVVTEQLANFAWP
jgi:Beta protein